MNEVLALQMIAEPEVDTAERPGNHSDWSIICSLITN